MQIDTNEFDTKLTRFVSSIYCVETNLTIKPSNNHICATINYFQIMQMRTKFITALFNTIIRYVYNDNEQHEFLTSIGCEAEESDAWLYLLQDCKDKFRICNIKGQFSELLLYNMLLYQYNAIPAVRKMKITTNPKLERNGADAIHIAYNQADSQYEIYLGEAKTYTCGFKAALKQAIGSIVNTYNEHLDELNLYRTPGLLEDNVKNIVVSYMDNKLQLKTNLVAIITYCCGVEKPGQSRAEILHNYIEDVRKNCSTVTSSDYPKVDSRVFNRITYIFFPINDLQALVDSFALKFN